MESELTELTVTPLELEVLPLPDERKTLSFRTHDGYYALTDSASADEEVEAGYFTISDVSYEDDSFSLYFEGDEKFQGEYEVVIFNWPMDEQIIDFFAIHLFSGTHLGLCFHADGRSRMH